MVEKIYVKNFGPIIDVEIEIKDINIFIGTTSSGKSTIAKLITIFKSDNFIYLLEESKDKGDHAYLLGRFSKLLSTYNIEFPIEATTLIRYERDELYSEVRADFIGSSFSLYTLPTINPVYIPAERVFFSTLSESIFSLISSDVSLPKWLLDFGSKFEKARREIKSFDIGFLNTKYSFADGKDTLELSNNKSIQLSQGSSGIQSIIPLMLVIQHLTDQVNDIRKELGYDLFVVEEPEMNLYPSSQRDLLEYIIKRIKRTSDKLILTTHSPYLLTALDNLVQAGNVAKEIGEEKEVLTQIVPEDLWTDFDDVTCYFFDKGTCRSTLDLELRSLGPSNIDDVSNDLGEVFDSLLTLKYKGR